MLPLQMFSQLFYIATSPPKTWVRTLHGSSLVCQILKLAYFVHRRRAPCNVVLMSRGPLKYAAFWSSRKYAIVARLRPVVLALRVSTLEMRSACSSTLKPISWQPHSAAWHQSWDCVQKSGHVQVQHHKPLSRHLGLAHFN